MNINTYMKNEQRRGKRELTANGLLGLPSLVRQGEEAANRGGGAAGASWWLRRWTAREKGHGLPLVKGVLRRSSGDEEAHTGTHAQGMELGDEAHGGVCRWCWTRAPWERLP